MSRKDLKPVEPAPALDVQSDAQVFFREAGWDEADVAWLAALCLKHQPAKFDPDDGLEDTVEHNLKVLAATLNDVGDRSRRSAALLKIFVRLCGCGGSETRLAWPSPTEAARVGLEEWRAIAREIRQSRPGRPDVDFEAALVTDGWPGQYGDEKSLAARLNRYPRHYRAGFYEQDHIIQVIEVLLGAANIDLTRVLEPGHLVETGMWVSPDPSPGDQVYPERLPLSGTQTSPLQIEPWLFAAGPRLLERLDSFVFDCPVEEAVTKALAIRDSLERWISASGAHWTSFKHMQPHEGVPILRFADRLESLVTEHKPRVGSRLRKAWLWYSLAAFEIPGQSPSPERRETLIRAATEEIGHLRKIFARARDQSPSPSSDEPAARTAAQDYAWHAEHFHDCVSILATHGGAWRAMKPLLLALRSLTAPCVAHDLRYWDEEGLESVPKPWGDVPRYLINVFLNRAHQTKASDPDLESLRGEFARFCLDRLLDRWNKAEREEAEKTGRQRSDADMVEPSEYWRYCYARAVSSLAINPDGTGHRTLHRSSEIDPSPTVREASRDAYERIRRGTGLEADASPVRAVLSALWWIRQGHLLGLDIQPDPNGAQRTRKKELSRTGKED